MPYAFFFLHVRQPPDRPTSFEDLSQPAGRVTEPDYLIRRCGCTKLHGVESGGLCFDRVHRRNRTASYKSSDLQAE